MVAMHREDATVRAIAERLCRSHASVQSKIERLRAQGQLGPKTYRMARHAPEVMRMRAEGVLIKDIAKAFGISRDTVGAIIRREKALEELRERTGPALARVRKLADAVAKPRRAEPRSFAVVGVLPDGRRLLSVGNVRESFGWDRGFGLPDEEAVADLPALSRAKHINLYDKARAIVDAVYASTGDAYVSLHEDEVEAALYDKPAKTLDEGPTVTAMCDALGGEVLRMGRMARRKAWLAGICAEGSECHDRMIRLRRLS